MRVPQGWSWFFIGFFTVFAHFFSASTPVAGKLPDGRKYGRRGKPTGWPGRWGRPGTCGGWPQGGKMAVFEVVGGAI